MKECWNCRREGEPLLSKVTGNEYCPTCGACLNRPVDMNIVQKMTEILAEAKELKWPDAHGL